MPALRHGRAVVSDVGAAAVAIAGALAEAGVVSLLVAPKGSGWRRVRARETDLPATLTGAARAGGVEVWGEQMADGRVLRLELDAYSAAWWTDVEQIHRDLADRLS